MLMTYSSLVSLMKLTQYKRHFKIIMFLIFTQESNTNNKISFLDALIDRMLTDLPLPHIKNLLIVPLAPSVSIVSTRPIKREKIIKILISRTKLLSSSRTIVLNELNNIKHTFINNGFPDYIVDTEIKHFINKTEQHIIDNTLNHKQLITLFYKKNYSNYKIDEHIRKNLIQKKVFPADPTKKVR